MSNDEPKELKQEKKLLEKEAKNYKQRKRKIQWSRLFVSINAKRSQHILLIWGKSSATC